LLRGLDRAGEDRHQLVGFTHQGVELRVHDEICLLDAPQPVERLTHLLIGNADLVNEIGAALCATRFFVVRSTARRRPHQLPKDVLRGWALRQRLAQPNYLHGEPA